MANVVFELTAESGNAVQGFVRVQAEIEKTSGKMKKLMEDTSQAGAAHMQYARAQERAGSAGVAVMQGLSGAIGAATAALGALGQVAERTLNTMIEKAKNAQQQMDTLRGALGAGGDVALLPEVQQALRGIKSSQYSQKQLGELFAASRQITKGKLSIQDELANVAETAAAGEAGYDPRAFLATRARIAAGAMRGGDQAEISDVTAEMMQVAPKGLDETAETAMSRMEAAGVDARSQMLFLKQSYRADETGKFMLKMLDVAEEKRLPHAATMELQQLEDSKRGFQQQGLRAPKAKKKSIERSLADIGVREDELRAQPKEAIGLKNAIENPALLLDDGMGMNMGMNMDGDLYVRNILAAKDENDFAGGGIFGKSLASARGTTMRDPRLRAMRQLRSAQVQMENFMGGGSVEETVAATEKILTDLEKKGAKGFTGAAVRLNDAVNPLAAGAEAATIQDRARLESMTYERPVRVEVSNLKPQAARNGSIEQTGARDE